MMPAIFSQEVQTPLEKNNFVSLSSYSQMNSYLKEISQKDNSIKLEYIAESVEGRKIPLLKISNGNFGEDKSKIKILVFAQQHGNEQSGKEGALLFIKDIVGGTFDKFLNNADLLLVPQMNPDGSQKNERRNGNDADLNRNHLILTQPEVIGLHKLFNEYLPEATLDVHEYYPYSDDWIKYGYIKNFDEQFGATTDFNVSEKIRHYSNQNFFPFVKKYLNERGFTFNNYILGGPPEVERIRYSTVDINDGRQSFGILNSFSFILEGLNGKDAFIDNIKHRAEGQKTAIEAFISFVIKNKNDILKLVHSERNKLTISKEGDPVSIRMEHVKGDSILKLTLKSISTGKDTLITVNEYHPVVKSILTVKKPAGYLVPKDSSNLVELLKNHNVKFEPFIKKTNEKIQKYYVEKIDSVFLEELMLPDPKIKIEEATEIEESKYYFVPINQLHSNMLVLGLEPQSMLGIIVYDEYKNWIQEGKYYPVLKIITKN
jgi:Zinc carboxypeptidase